MLFDCELRRNKFSLEYFLLFLNVVKSKRANKIKGNCFLYRAVCFIYLYFGEIGCVTSPNSTVLSVLTLTLTQTSSSLTSYVNKSRCFSKSFTILTRERKNHFFYYYWKGRAVAVGGKGDTCHTFYSVAT